MSRLHQPSGLNTHFPMQHHSLTVNTAWKTANAIFSNGCYEEGEIVASRKTGSGVDRQCSLWLQDQRRVRMLLQSAVGIGEKKKKKKHLKMQFFCLKEKPRYIITFSLSCSIVVTFTTLK